MANGLWYTVDKVGGMVNQRFLRLLKQGFLLIGILLSLTACSLLGSGPALGDTADLQGQAVVTCSTSCATRGQCGSAPDGSQVVLGGQAGPAVEGHDLRFTADTTVPIYDSSIQRVRTITTQEEFDLRFYLIQREDGVTGWVAGWCLAAE